MSDRFSKNSIIENFANNDYFFNNYINLNLIWNTGVGFGLLSTNATLLYNLTTFIIGIIIICIIYFAMKSTMYDKIMFSLIAGGAIGNIYDRIIYKAVPDFIDLHVKNFHWFTFNFADIFITIGVIFLLTKGVFIKNE